MVDLHGVQRGSVLDSPARSAVCVRTGHSPCGWKFILGQFHSDRPGADESPQRGPAPGHLGLGAQWPAQRDPSVLADGHATGGRADADAYADAYADADAYAYADADADAYADAYADADADAYAYADADADADAYADAYAYAYADADRWASAWRQRGGRVHAAVDR